MVLLCFIPGCEHGLEIRMHQAFGGGLYCACETHWEGRNCHKRDNGVQLGKG